MAPDYSMIARVSASAICPIPVAKKRAPARCRGFQWLGVPPKGHPHARKSGTRTMRTRQRDKTVTARGCAVGGCA